MPNPKLFVNVVTLSNDFQPIAKGVGASNILWMTVKSRTNSFTISGDIDGIDGYRIDEGAAQDFPIADTTNQTEQFSLEGLYWKNTTSGTNAVVEIIGMRL